MKKISIFLFLGLIGLNACQNQGNKTLPNSLVFGNAMQDTTGINADSAVLNASRHFDTINIVGTVANVCQSEGCWFNMNLDSNRLLFVDFAQKFHVPAQIAGKKVLVRGHFYRDTISVDDLRKTAEQSGKTKEEVALITEPKTELNFRASGVRILVNPQP
jgi:hypothetical protein